MTGVPDQTDGLLLSTWVGVCMTGFGKWVGTGGCWLSRKPYLDSPEAGR
jgi:hypothetical protein